MITEKDLQEAIKECEGVPHPNANTCIKLAAYYTILRNLRGDEETFLPSYSYDNAPSINYSDTEFSQIMETKGIEKAFPVIDELITALAVLNPRLYQSFIIKLRDV